MNTDWEHISIDDSSESDLEISAPLVPTIVMPIYSSSYIDQELKGDSDGAGHVSGVPENYEDVSAVLCDEWDYPAIVENVSTHDSDEAFARQLQEEEMRSYKASRSLECIDQDEEFARRLQASETNVFEDGSTIDDNFRRDSEIAKELQRIFDGEIDNDDDNEIFSADRDLALKLQKEEEREMQQFEDDFNSMLKVVGQKDLSGKTIAELMGYSASNEFPQPFGSKQTNTSMVKEMISSGFPDINKLFTEYDEKYFKNGLFKAHRSGIPVFLEWSSRMTQCAGICYFKRSCVIVRLSAPLLKQRPIADLKQTLLHEMIHAYLFLNKAEDDRQGHGPAFQRHMERINQMGGFNITIYHTFHDEVRSLQRHSWRCDGVCRFAQPYFGFVHRAMNRAPGPSDTWWARHKQACGGEFVKISEPEKVEKSGKKSKKSKLEDPLEGSNSVFNNSTGKKIRTIDDPPECNPSANLLRQFLGNRVKKEDKISLHVPSVKNDNPLDEVKVKSQQGRIVIKSETAKIRGSQAEVTDVIPASNERAPFDASLVFGSEVDMYYEEQQFSGTAGLDASFQNSTLIEPTAAPKRRPRQENGNLDNVNRTSSHANINEGDQSITEGNSNLRETGEELVAILPRVSDGGSESFMGRCKAILKDVANVCSTITANPKSMKRFSKGVELASRAVDPTQSFNNQSNNIDQLLRYADNLINKSR